MFPTSSAQVSAHGPPPTHSSILIFLFHHVDSPDNGIVLVPPVATVVAHAGERMPYLLFVFKSLIFFITNLYTDLSPVSPMPHTPGQHRYQQGSKARRYAGAFGRAMTRTPALRRRNSTYTATYTQNGFRLHNGDELVLAVARGDHFRTKNVYRHLLACNNNVDVLLRRITSHNGVDNLPNLAGDNSPPGTPISENLNI